MIICRDALRASVFFHSFLRFVESERAPSAQNIDFRMVMVVKKMIGYAVGANNYSPIQNVTSV